jgi:hypothetical protein
MISAMPTDCRTPLFLPNGTSPADIEPMSVNTLMAAPALPPNAATRHRSSRRPTTLLPPPMRAPS